MGLQRETDGCYHPVNEEELCELVKDAARDGKQLRVLGSTHSVWRSIVTDNFNGPKTPDREVPVVLDRYTRVFEARTNPADASGKTKLVTVQAGCHVGLAPDRPVQARIIERPFDSDVRQPSPWHEGSWEASFTSTLHHRDGLALPDLGGITHQTVAGFISTGSAGGTVKWSVHDAIVELRVIDGLGEVHTLTFDAPRKDWFCAAGVGLGLCGVISTITFACEPTYDIVGSETISHANDSPDLDFYGSRGGVVPTLEQFLLQTDYTRLMWWPQRDFDRLVVWQATRAPFEPDRQLVPYKEIAKFPVASQVAASLVYTLLGHLENPEGAVEALREIRNGAVAIDFTGLLEKSSRWMNAAVTPMPTSPEQLFPWITSWLKRVTDPDYSPVTMGAAWLSIVELLVTGSDDVIAFVLKVPGFRQLFKLIGTQVPKFIHLILEIFVTLGPNGTPAVQQFCDRGFMGLPMDNQMDDLLLPTWFTELWVPFTPGDGKVQQTISLLRAHFDAGDAADQYAATGPFSFELYAGKKDERFFLHAANHSHVFRVDVFWFGKNTGNPVTGFYEQFWKLLAPLEYRLHWGKFLPEADGTREAWLSQRYPDWGTWKATRERIDPKQVFLNRYWKAHLGLEEDGA